MDSHGLPPGLTSGWDGSQNWNPFQLLIPVYCIGCYKGDNWSSEGKVPSCPKQELLIPLGRWCVPSSWHKIAFVHQPQTSLYLLFRGSYWGFRSRHVYSSLWLLVSNPISITLFSPEVWMWHTGSFIPVIWLVPLATSPYPEAMEGPHEVTSLA